MKIIRVICYEGNLDDLHRQMASSLPDCRRAGTKGVTIEIRTVVDERPKDVADATAVQVRKMMDRAPPTATPSLSWSGVSSEFAESEEDN